MSSKQGVIWVVITLICFIIALELFISKDIQTHSKSGNIVSKNLDNTHAFNINDILPITSYLKPSMTNKEWLNIIKSRQHSTQSPQDCNVENWMDGLYEIFQPLNTWKFYENIPIIKHAQTFKDYNEETIILIMDDINDINHEIDYNLSDLSTFKQWTVLGDSSLLIRRIFDINDIDLMGRFIEWLWAKNWMGHIRNDPDCTPSNDHCRDNHLYPVRIESVSCWKCGCILEKKTMDQTKWRPIIQNTTFFKIANKTLTDKVMFHFYHKLYGKYLEKYYYINQGIFLEIGLGCNMGYGPGHSGKIWVELFNNVEFIEYDGECISKYKNMIDQSGYLVHVGSQEDVIFLEELKESERWKENGLDIIIDDGGHWNKQIIISFLSLWPILNDGGLYFIEDFQESAYIKNYLDSKPITFWGKEQPGTAQYFIKKQIIYQLFCKITGQSCYDINYIQCVRDICLIKKKIVLH